MRRALSGDRAALTASDTAASQLDYEVGDSSFLSKAKGLTEANQGRKEISLEIMIDLHGIVGYRPSFAEILPSFVP